MYFAKIFGNTCIFLVIFSILGCGGGSGGGEKIQEPKNIYLSGTAAAGAPIAGKVNVKGTAGLTTSATIDTNGEFNLDVTELQAPYILFAEGSVNGKSLSLYTIAVEAGNINITPITDFIVRNALSITVASAYDSWSAATIDSSVLANEVSSAQTQLQPVLSAAGVSNEIDLLTTPFNADHTGLDQLLDILDISYNGDIATVSNTLTGSSFLDNTTMTGDGIGFAAAEEIITVQALSDQAGITGFWQSLNTLYSTQPTSDAISTWVTNNLANDFLQVGFSRDLMRDDWVLGYGPGVGEQISGSIVGIFDVNGTTYDRGYYVQLASAENNQVPTDLFATIMVFDGTNWLWFGDQTWMEFGANSHAYWFVSSFGVSSGSGIEFLVEDSANYAYDQGARSAIVTGPGMPEGGLIFEHGFPRDRFQIYQDPYSGVFYQMDDQAINDIPDNAQYNIQLCSATASEIDAGTMSCDDLQVYSHIIATPPLLSTELSAGHFASLTGITGFGLDQLPFGENITFNWTNPEGTLVDGVNFLWFTDGSRYNLDQEVGKQATSVTFDALDTVPAANESASIFIRVVDEFGRHYNYSWIFGI